MARWEYSIDESEVELIVPIEICKFGHKHVPVKGKCLICEYNKFDYSIFSKI